MLRSTIAVVVACATGFGAWQELRPCHAADLCVTEAARVAVAGRYVEARTASVFAGACHYNGELVTAGREALLAWRFESGVEAGVELAGLVAVGLVRANENLKLTTQRESVLYVPRGLERGRRDALVAAVTRSADAALGDVLDVRELDVAVEFSGDAYSVRVGDDLELTGSLDADRACCRMPQNVWYEPLVALERPLVGKSDVFRVHEPRLHTRFSRHDANDAFVGSFGERAEPARDASTLVATPVAAPVAALVAAQ
ncbi:MAG: DUF1326 domain-containing protein [Planctomycetes bacterium]|nr:DUF1326 domain-containing protein [Planctomycetota bacterium]